MRFTHSASSFALIFYATLSQSERSSPCSRDKARTVTSRHTRDVNKVKFGCTDHVSTMCNPVFFSIGNCFDQIEPSGSATEHSGVRFRNYWPVYSNPGPFALKPFPPLVVSPPRRFTPGFPPLVVSPPLV